MSIAYKRTPRPKTESEPILNLDLFSSRSYRFTVAQYERMVETGILTPGDRVELLGGVIVKKMAQNPPHAQTIDNAQDELRPILPSEWRVREQKPIRLPSSQPEPDLAVVRRNGRRRYARRHPEVSDIGLIIEVSDSTLLEDRSFKGRLYAEAGVPIYWIINLVEAKVEVYSRPRAGKEPAYRERRDYSKDESVPVIVAGVEIGSIAVRDLLP